jgi:hypothetical protein
MYVKDVILQIINKPASYISFDQNTLQVCSCNSKSAADQSFTP